MSESAHRRQRSEIFDSLRSESLDDEQELQNLDNLRLQTTTTDDEVTFDDCFGPVTIQVHNSTNVQIGPFFKFNDPFQVSQSCMQNMPQVDSDSVVHPHNPTDPCIGSRMNHYGPVAINQIVNVDDQEYEPESLAIHSQVVDTKSTVRLIDRKTWMANPSKEALTPLKHPVRYVVILHTASDESPTEPLCISTCQQIQLFHTEGYGWWDIGYSFLIGGDGNVYEGRGWDAVGTFAKGYNHLAIGLAVIGTFTNVLPSDRQIHALRFWIQEGVRLGKISPDYKILTHNQLSATTSPGTAFIKLIQTWSRWSNTPSS